MKKLFTLVAVCLLFTQNSFAQCTADIPYQTFTCQDATTSITATLGGDNYEWIVNGALVQSGTSDTWVVPTSAPNTFTVVVNITFGTCTAASNTATVTVNPETAPPVVVSPFTPCQYSQPGPIPVTGSSLLWYTVPVGGVGVPFAPVVNTSTVYTTIYYVSQTLNGCESERAQIIVTVNPTPQEPLVASPTILCQYEAYQLQATGQNLLWYMTPVGGVGVPTMTANTSVQSTTTYYVSQTVGICEGERAPLVIHVLPNPSIANVSYVDPAYPAFGTITLDGLSPNTSYVVNYLKDNVVQSPLAVTSNGSGSVIMTALTEGTYADITVTLNGCTSDEMGPYLLVQQNTFPGDVWPGDVNYDQYANNDDVLDLGLAYGATGAVRSGATNNWTNQACTDWGTAQVNGADMKHADCNGDGTVDANDQDAITLNYGMYHPKGVHLPQAKSAALPDLYFDLTGINFVAGTTVSVPIKLGTGTLPMNNILGIAAKIKVQNVTLDNAPAVNNTTSWIGNGTNTMNFYKGVSSNQTDWALVRTDHNNVSGDGTIATLVMDIPVGSTGDAILYFEGVKIINSLGDVLTDYNVVDDTASIVPVAISNTESASNKIVIVPNPSEGQANLEVTLAESTKLDITITDITGKKVWHHSMKAGKDFQSISLPFAQLVPGAYNILLTDEKGKVSTIKWIKK